MWLHALFPRCLSLVLMFLSLFLFYFYHLLFSYLLPLLLLFTVHGIAFSSLMIHFKHFGNMSTFASTRTFPFFFYFISFDTYLWMSDYMIKICSLNCQGLGDQNKRRDVFSYLRKHNYSIICLQDTHFTKSRERVIENEWGYKAFFNSFDSRSRGVAVLFNNNFEFKIHQFLNDTSGNFCC